MLLTERQINPEISPADLLTGIRLRIQSAGAPERIIDLPYGKTMIGSSPRCDLRLPLPGVCPLHVLIVHNRDNLTVRSWAADTRLNGEPFDESPLTVGDCLSVGSLVLGIEDLGSECDAHEVEFRQLKQGVLEQGVAPVAKLAPVDELTFSAESSPSKQLAAEFEPAERQDVWEAGTTSAGATSLPSIQAVRNSDRGRSRKLIAELRKNRNEYRRLAERVEGLECLMQAAQSERDSLQRLSSASSRKMQATETRPDASQIQSRSTNIVDVAEPNQAIAERDAIAAERAQLHEQIQQYLDANERLAHEKAALEGQLAELAPRLAEYARRIEVLEDELAAMRANASVPCESSTASDISPVGFQSTFEGPSVSSGWSGAEKGFGEQSAAAAWPGVSDESKYSAANPSPTSELPPPVIDWSNPGKFGGREWLPIEAGDDRVPAIPAVPETSLRQDSNREIGPSDPLPDFPTTPPHAPASVHNWPTGEFSNADVNLRAPVQAASDREGVPSPPVAVGHFTWPALSPVEPHQDGEDELAPFAEFSIWKQGAGPQVPVAQQPWTEPAGPDIARGESSGFVAENAAEFPAELHATRSFTNEGAEAKAESAITPPDHECVERGLHVQPTADKHCETAAQKTQPNSFIERYAHMFADEESGVGVAQLPAPVQPPADEGVVQKPRCVGVVKPVVSAPASSDDEESIEQYMAKLMQRVRGDTPHVQASQVQIAPAAPETPRQSAMVESPQTVGGVSSSPQTTSVPRTAETNHEFLTTSLGTVRRKPTMGEQSANLEAFRALANESARHAISTHALHKHRQNAITKSIVSTLAGMTSVFVMLESPSWYDLQFITACVSLVAAAYWAGQTYGTVLESFRAAAYDGPDELLENLLDPFHLPLPIDVER